ncbi:uncharacterized protein LOC116412377 [Xenopus tropicalis]|uniref:Uncharacterized protein LOC116412377 n=1 Tax=Xenopus tropicalis TaxID=8364 RepID=A0A8J1JWY6_XENTR|nr:uncharacterized protein LOC116412377 [Xenopus tropicalis]
MKKFLAAPEAESATKGDDTRPTQIADPSEDSDGDSATSEHSARSYLKTLPTKKDLRNLAKQITTLKEEIADIETEIASLLERTAEVESRNEGIENSIDSLIEVNTAHTKTIQSLLRKMDDLDNRRRRNNLRTRGLPETFDRITKQLCQPCTGYQKCLNEVLHCKGELCSLLGLGRVLAGPIISQRLRGTNSCLLQYLYLIDQDLRVAEGEDLKFDCNVNFLNSVDEKFEFVLEKREELDVSPTQTANKPDILFHKANKDVSGRYSCTAKAKDAMFPISRFYSKSIYY